MLSCALARYLRLKLANVNISESMLMYKPNVLYSVGQKYINEGLHFFILNRLNAH